MEELNNLEFANTCWIILLPLILMIVDIITGYVNAWKTKSVSSSRMRDGLGKKLAEIVYITIGVLIGMVFNLQSIGRFISLYIIYMEIMSIAENCKKLGVKMPEKIQEKLNNNDKGE